MDSYRLKHLIEGKTYLESLNTYLLNPQIQVKEKFPYESQSKGIDRLKKLEKEACEAIHKLIDELREDEDYWKLVKELQNAEGSEVLNRTKLVYRSMEFGKMRIIGVPIPIFDGTSKVKEWYVCLDPDVKYFPYEIKIALVEHEKVHFFGGRLFLPDREDDENRLIVDTIAYIESGNPFCLIWPYIIKDVYSFIRMYYFKP